MTRQRLRLAVLVRKVLLPPVLAGVAVACMLGALALTASAGSRVKVDNPLLAGGERQLAVSLSMDVEGTPAPRDVRRARRPLSERRRQLDKHPYYDLYALAQRRFGVPWVLVASIHYQETGFGRRGARRIAPPAWERYRHASRRMTRPISYPHRSSRHPSLRDDFDVVMAIAAQLRTARSRKALDGSAVRAVARRYGEAPQGRVSAAMVVERARAWRLLGTIPQPGRGELVTPTAGVVGGCGYFGCPRPGHQHNGVDFLAPTGTPIHASDAGIVALVEAPGASGGYGNFVCVQHRPHLASCYAHLSVFAARVRVGARVRRGEVIGLVGSTGSSTAPHLHFEVRRGPASCQGCAVDPLALLSGEVPQSALPNMLSNSASGVAASPASAVAPAPAPVQAVVPAAPAPAIPGPADGAPADPGPQPPAEPDPATPAPVPASRPPVAPKPPSRPAPAAGPTIDTQTSGGASPPVTEPPAVPAAAPPEPPA